MALNICARDNGGDHAATTKRSGRSERNRPYLLASVSILPVKRARKRGCEVDEEQIPPPSLLAVLNYDRVIRDVR